MEAFKVIQKGIYTTLQDLGRIGYRNYGVPVSGAIDRDSFINANRLVGNDDNAPCLEILANGLTLKTLDDFKIALTGGEAIVSIDEVPVRQYEPIDIKKGQTLEIKGMINGLRTYLSVEGGIKGERIMGSVSVNERILMGKALRNGDLVERNLRGEDENMKPLVKIRKRHEFHVFLGPDLDMFTREGLKTFLKNEFTVSGKLDRMGIRLDGEKIEHVDKADVVSHPVVFGCIQVPDDGNPIILLADCQTTGGYSVIGCIRKNDLSRLGQLKAGDKIRFRKCR